MHHVELITKFEWGVKPMKCPYCNVEMEIGILEGGIFYGQKSHISIYHLKQTGILLGEKAVGSVGIDSYICKQCKDYHRLC